MLQHLSEDDVILQLDGSTVVPQIPALQTLSQSSQLGSVGSCVNGNQTDFGAVTRISNLPVDPSLIDISAATQEIPSAISPEAGVQTSGEGEGEEGGREGVSGVRSINPVELMSMELLLSRQLVQGLVLLLAEVPLL